MLKKVTVSRSKVGWVEKDTFTLTHMHGLHKNTNAYTQVIQAKQRHCVWWKSMHMSDAISAAFGDLSEISCHWGLRNSLFKSTGDCHVPNTLVTVSSCLRAWEMYETNKPKHPLLGTAPGGLLTKLGPCLHPGDAANTWTHSYVDTMLYPRVWSQIRSTSHVMYIWCLTSDLWCLT